MRSTFILAIGFCLFGTLSLAGCSVTSTSDSCTLDAAFACSAGLTAYSCGGTTTPLSANSQLVCNAGVADGNGNTDYCCAPASAPAACVVDTTVTGCTGSATPYSCTGSEVPTSTNPALSCGAGTAGPNGSIDYCCQTTIAGSCAADASVAGCSAGSTGYSCSSTDAPSQSDPTLVCSSPVSGAEGTMLYCCSSFNTTAGCQQDTTVAGCSSGSTGFSCTGNATPSQTDSSLVCSAPVTASSGELLYCCNNLGASSCTLDSSVVGCTGGSYGFSCTSTDTPAQADSSLTCSTPVTGAEGTLLYCCTR